MNDLCQTCKSTLQNDVLCDGGWIETPSDSPIYTAQMARCKQWTAHLASQRLSDGMSSAGLDEARYADGWNDLEMTERTWRAAREVGTNISEVIAEGLNIVAYGQTGRGKTHAAVLICRDAMSSGHSVAKVVWADFLSNIRDTFNRKGEGILSERQQIQRLVDADLVFLDDVGSAGSDGSNGKDFF